MPCLDKWSGTTKNGNLWSVFRGNACSVLSDLNENQFNCVITSPPYYWLRDYGVEEQIGQEATVEEYVYAIASVMDEVKRVMNKDGVLFLNLVKRYLDIGCPPDGVVLDPFAGGGTTLRVALESGRSATGVDLNPDFCNYMVKTLNAL